MADTIVDPPEPVPPTQRDPVPVVDAPPPEAPLPEATPPKRKLPRVLFALVALLVALALGGAALWFFFLRYEPTARAHIPAGTNIAVRIEAADIVLFGPVRDHILPIALESGSKGEAPAGPKERKRAEKITDKTGVRLPLDIREVIVASMDGKSWVALVGGRISRGRFVSGLAEIAKEEDWAGFRLDGELLVGPKFLIGQADDGTIVIGTDRSIVEAALPATAEGQKLGLSEKGAVTFVIGKQAWEASSALGPLDGRAPSLAKISRGTGALTLGKSPELVLHLEPTNPADAPAIAEGARTLLRELGLLLLLAPDVAGEKEALRAASVDAAGSSVVIRAPWPYEGLDRGARRLAEALREAR